MTKQSATPETIELNGVTYVRETQPSGLTLVVLDRGFIFAGVLDDTDPERWKLTNAKNVRRWSEGGLGGLSRSAESSGAELDNHEPIFFSSQRVIYSAALPTGWLK